MALICMLICLCLIPNVNGQGGRASGAMSDICSRSPGTSLCQWYGGRSATSQSASFDSLNQRPADPHPLPPAIPLPQNAIDEKKVYCDKYKPSFGYFCSGRPDIQAVEFCNSYGNTCGGGGVPSSGTRQGTGTGSIAQDLPQPTTPKPTFKPVGNVASSCKEYKAVYDAYCIGKESGFTRIGCDQYRHYCAGYKEPPAPLTTLPPNVAEYCGNYAKDYVKLCSGTRPTPVRATHFCQGYNSICTAFVNSQGVKKPPSAPNFGDQSNPLAPSYPNKEQNFGGNTNPIVNPDMSGPPVVVPPTSGTVPNAAGGAPSSPSQAVASLPTWPGLQGGNLQGAPSSAVNSLPPSPFGGSGIPRSDVGGGGSPNLGVGNGFSAPMFGSSQGTSFGPNGIGSGSNTQAGPIGVSSGSGLGFSPNGIGTSSGTQAGPIGVSSGSGLGFTPNGFGTSSGTQAGPIGVSSGSSFSGSSNIPGLGSLGNGIPFLGKRK